MYVSVSESNGLNGTERSLSVLDRRLEVLDMLVVSHPTKLEIDDDTHLAAEILGCGFRGGNSEIKS